ncbi:MAG: hypothetical protein GF334_02405 [Candidatus Altiarchaeales archaeon]|nr:hypothetical protein [Candidatus Altiarchaeales archaeon]
MIKAELTLDSQNPSAVSQALEVDNIQSEGLTVSCQPEDNSIIFNVKTESVSTLIATLDDLIKCHKAAGGALDG